MKWGIRPTMKIFRTGIVQSNSWHAFRNSLKCGVERVGTELGYSTASLIRPNKSLSAMDHDFGANNKTLLTFSDGTKIAASIVLACDGTLFQRCEHCNRTLLPVLLMQPSHF